MAGHADTSSLTQTRRTAPQAPDKYVGLAGWLDPPSRAGTRGIRHPAARCQTLDADAPGPAPRARTRRSNGAGPLGFEGLLWKAADKPRDSMDASEYKHVVLGLIFLKYVTDAFEERHATLEPELVAHTTDLIEADNPSIRGVLPNTYARSRLDQRRLGELVDLSPGISPGSAEHHEKDLLARVYKYFLGKFASAESRQNDDVQPRSQIAGIEPRGRTTAIRRAA